jgi:hypothetical protein
MPSWGSIGDQPTTFPIYTEAVKLCALAFAVVTGLGASVATCQSVSSRAERATVCDVVNHPSHFIGKTVEVRAQIWADSRHPGFFWMNKSSLPSGTACRFLWASLKDDGNNLGGATAFGTFRGRVVKKLWQKSNLASPDPKGPQVVFLVDQVSDIYLKRDYLQGPVPLLQLYDRKTASFVRPED